MNFFQVNNNNFIDRSYDNANWVKVLPLINRPLQASELIEIQSLLQKNLKDSLENIIDNGSILEGLEITEIEKNNESITLNINKGSIWFEGYVIEIKGLILSVSRIEESLIGINIKLEIIDYLSNPELRNNTELGTEYGSPGAARLIYKTEIVINDPNSIVIAKIKNQNLETILDKNKTTIENSIENYIYETNGNFLIKGFEVNLIEKGLSIDLQKEESNLYLLETEINELENEVLNLNNSSLSLTSSYQELNQEILDIRNNLLLNNSINNQLNLNNLENQKENLLTQINNLNLELNIKQLNLQKIKDSYNQQKQLYSQNYKFSIGNGIAYILGKRINNKNIYNLDINLTPQIESIENAVYFYKGNIIKKDLSFNLKDPIEWEQIFQKSWHFEFTISNIQVENKNFQIKLLSNLNLFQNLQNPLKENNLLFNLEEYLENFVLAFNNSKQKYFEYIQYQSNYEILNLKQILISAIKLEKIYTNKLTFSLLKQNSVINIKFRIVEKKNNAINPVDLLFLNEQNISLNINLQNEFKLGFSPVVNLKQITGEKLVKEVPIVHNNIVGGTDFLPEDTTIEIVKIYQKEIEYIENTDWQFVNQNQIVWNLDGLEPDVGSTYYIDLIYNKLFKKDIDYIYNSEKETIVFTKDHPELNKRFEVSYTYQLSQKGIIYLLATGEINYLLTNTINSSLPENALKLADFEIQGSEVKIKNLNDLIPNWSKVLDYINLTQQNQNTLEKLLLNNQLRTIASEDKLNYSETIGENFLNFNNLDIYNANFSANYLGILGAWTYPSEVKDVDLVYNPTGEAIEKNNNLYLPYGSNKFLEQSRITSSLKIKKSNRKNKKGILFADKNLIFFNENSKLYSSCDPTLDLISLNKRLETEEFNLETQKKYLAKNEEIQESIVLGNSCYLYEKDILPELQNTTKSQYLTINLSAWGLVPNSDGFKVYLSGKLIAFNKITRLYNTPAGILNEFSLKTKSDGSLHIRLDLEGIDTGCHLIEIYNKQSYCSTKISIYNNIYNRIILGTNLNWSLLNANEKIANFNLPIQEIENNNLEFYQNFYPSIIQTFSIETDLYLESIQIKLKNTDLNANLKLTIFENSNKDFLDLDNILTQINFNNLIVDEDGYNWMTLILDYPIILLKDKNYAIGLETDQEFIEVFIGEIGKKDLINNSLIGEQILFPGKLYYSQDNINYEYLKDKHLTFNLFKCNFETNTVKYIDLKNYEISNNILYFDSFALNIRPILHNQCTLDFEYRLNNELEWKNFDINISQCLKQKTNSLHLRAKFFTKNSDLSPVINLAHASVSLEAKQKKAILISKKQKVISYKEIIFYIDGSKDVNTIFKIYFNPTDIVNNWILLEEDLNYIKDLNSSLNYFRYKFIYNNGILLSNSFRYKIEIYNNSNNISVNSSFIKNIFIYLN